MQPGKPDICFLDPGAAIRAFMEGQDNGVGGFVRSVKRGLVGIWAFVTTKLATAAT